MRRVGLTAISARCQPGHQAGRSACRALLAAQSWAWGYEPRNPPLYTWLLMGAYSAFGVTQIAHVFVKYALLLATFVFAYLCGRRLFKTPGYAELSALSLMLVHLVGISMQTRTSPATAHT